MDGGEEQVMLPPSLQEGPRLEEGEAAAAAAKQEERKLELQPDTEYCSVMEALTWKRPFCTLASFLCANLLFWFLALTPWKFYHLVSLVLLGIVFIQMMKELVLSRLKGGQLWRRLTDYRANIDPDHHSKDRHLQKEHLQIATLKTAVIQQKSTRSDFLSNFYGIGRSPRK